jgi:hypothetical protein
VAVAAGDAARILLDLTFARFSAGDVPAAWEAAERARTHAEVASDEPLLGEALAVTANVAFFAGRGLDEGRVHRACALEDPANDRPILVRPSAIAALFALYAGRLPEACSRLTDLRLRAAERGDESDCQFLTWLTWAQTWLGQLHAARGTAEEALTLAAQAGSETLRGAVLMHRGMVETYLGSVDAAREDLSAGWELLNRTGWVTAARWARWTEGLLELSLGRHAAAV